MKATKTRPPQRGRTTKYDSAILLERTGDDPATLLLLMDVMDRIIASRRPRRAPGRSDE